MSSRNLKTVIRCGSILLLAVAALLTLAPAEAQGVPGGGVPGGGGGMEETTGNNLSYPVVLVGGATLSLREPPTGFDFSLLGAYWYGWIDAITLEQLACDPAITGCPPPGVEISRIYLQKDPLSVWQAAHMDSAVPVTAAYLDWSDNLESTVWSASSIVRVETVPFAVATGALGFEMWWASGKGVDEVWGARAPNADPAVPTGYPFSPNYATIYSTNAWLTLQKLEPGGGSQSAPPDTSAFVWNPAVHKWDGVAGQTTRLESYTAEINVGGKAIYGFNWNVKRQVMAAGETKDGWWRLTFSTSANTIVFDANTVNTPPNTPPLAEYTFTPRFDYTNNLTYIDIFLKAAKGGGSSRR